MFHRMPRILRSALIVLLVFSGFTASAQNCIEIESILVDACDGGNFSSDPEGNNEMFRFKTGPNPISILEITLPNLWPSGSPNNLVYNGWIQNSTTQAKTAELNATIQNQCGFLLEPVEGIIPENSRVIAITSYSVSSTLNSFANLTDTLFIIYHNVSGVAGGHFLNFTAGNPQEQILTIQIGGVNGCTEQVSYLRGSLVDLNGNNIVQNGAYVDFTPDGTPTYGNTGCQAPFEPFSADWTNPGPFCQTSAPVDLTTFITGSLGGTFTGQGVTGNTFDPAGLNGVIQITYTVVPTNDCNTIPAEVTQDITVSPSVDATFTNPGTICGADVGTINLNTLVTGTPGGNWAGSGVSNGILNVTGQNGSVTVTYNVGSGTCVDTESQTFNIINLSTPVVSGQTVYCNGDAPQVLTASGDAGATVTWFADAGLSLELASSNTFTPLNNQSTTYYVQQTQDGCSSDSVAVEVEFSVVEVPTGDTLYRYCVDGAIPTASVSSLGAINWYTNSNLNTPIGSGTTFTTSQESDTLYVTSTVGACESEPLVVIIEKVDSTTALISAFDGTDLCPGDPLELSSSSADLNEWSTGSNTQSITVEVAGNYTLTREGFCNTATDQIAITGLPVTTDFITDVDSGYTVLPVNVNDLTINGETCSWYLNDSLLAFTAPGTITFPDSGTYELKLICTNSTGCIDSTSKTIKVLTDKLILVVPNVFSPNGDNLNELFKVKYNAVKTFQARVFTRWGKMLYSWDVVSGGWDGTFNGEKMNDGTYFYIINGTDVKDQPFEEKGTVTLLGN